MWREEKYEEKSICEKKKKQPSKEYVENEKTERRKRREGQAE